MVDVGAAGAAAGELAAAGFQFITEGGGGRMAVQDAAATDAGTDQGTAPAPFGVYKQSGIGREMGVAGLEEFLERKTLAAVVS